ncbi:MAG TPA: hypothetical protein VLL95_15075, partial [Phnomibacter sp.]|nr:hypothetical protein [Phnomibacter sp.]
AEQKIATFIFVSEIVSNNRVNRLAGLPFKSSSFRGSENDLRCCRRYGNPQFPKVSAAIYFAHDYRQVFDKRKPVNEAAHGGRTYPFVG